MNRRTFLKIAGIGSIAFAAGCTSQPEKNLYGLIHAPDDLTAGKATWYASTCRECPAGCGILAKNREGRVIKLEGNPAHPINQGAICMRGQAALQGIYNPDRLKTPLIKENGVWQPIRYDQAENLIIQKTLLASQKSSNRVAILSEAVGNSLLSLFQEALQQWRSNGPILFEPYAYESLKAAHETVLGTHSIPSYHLDQADLLIGFGADFLETWLSPVEYTRKFKAMHAFQDHRKGMFIHISPFQSLTAANADYWIPCLPGGEAIVVFGLIREMLNRGRGRGLPDRVHGHIADICASYTASEVTRLSGICAEDFGILANRLTDATRPLVLGASVAMEGGAAMQTDTGATLLNLVLDPQLRLYDFQNRHRIECAAKRSEVLALFETIENKAIDVLLLNNTNPVFTFPPSGRLKEIISRENLFVVSFTCFMDETAALSDLVVPVQPPLETWDAYESKTLMTGILQPAMGPMVQSPGIGDILLRCAFGENQPAPDYKSYLVKHLNRRKSIENYPDWITAVQTGGIFKEQENLSSVPEYSIETLAPETVGRYARPSAVSLPKTEFVFMAVPSLRFYDGRGANKPWLNEAPDPVSLISWQTVAQLHSQTLAARGWKPGDWIQIQSESGILQAPVFESPGVHPGVIAMSIGQGHSFYGRYAENQGHNPLVLLAADTNPLSGGPSYITGLLSVSATGQNRPLAHLDGSRIQHDRKIAVSCDLHDLDNPEIHDRDKGLGMWEFPFTLPLPEGYDSKRDIYPPHQHVDYRWGMLVDLDRCVGCGACTVACYAENNIGTVGDKQILKGHKMAWLQIERYYDPSDMKKIIFLPMMCQHCDNAPCESVCPVYASHHNKEGLNNQIYNRCIGTRFCGQNCPYKVRRFNWFSWEWPEPLPLQLNPDVTVRSKGVMEKCSFCIQRIKDGHDTAKNEKRMIRDGEVVPACAQTCPAHAIVFGNLMDPGSRLRTLVEDRRAYQVLGYLNTKPSVIYLKKVVQKI